MSGVMDNDALIVSPNVKLIGITTVMGYPLHILGLCLFI